MADSPLFPGTPRWVKLAGAAAVVLALAVLALVLFGGGKHGPSRHLMSYDESGTVLASIAENHAGSAGGFAKGTGTEAFNR